MSSASRDSSRDRELVLKHQPSLSDQARLPVPMWDSSDPERAPPPLPLNPGTGAPITRPNASPNVTAAAEAIAARARESQYPTSPTKSPERSLIRGHHHRRMQSLHTSTNGVKDLSSYLENRPPEKSPEKPFKLPIELDFKSPDRPSSRGGSPTPTSREPSKDTSSMRPSSRPGLKAILGETPPQSATMRALHSTPTNENEPLSNITNNSSALVRTPQNMDGISNQILGLTSICTRLQQEMAALSRRSKDNATDLVSLREATCTRDEDIRKSLKDLVLNISIKQAELEQERASLGKPPGRHLLEERSMSTPAVPKSFSLPRIPSPASFSASLERELNSSPNPYSVDGAAAIALLDKILREMGTKEGQEKLLSSVSEMSASKPDSRIGKHLEEVIGLLKEQSTSRALVRSNGTPQMMEMMQGSQNVTPFKQTNGQATAPFSSPRAADFVSEDMLKLLRKIKDSVAEGGGISAETKSLVRDLRGEVLGMGREMGRKLDQAESTKNDSRDDARGPGREEISEIVEQGLADLKEHMDRVMSDHRRQSSASFASRNTVDSQEVYNAVKAAMRDMPIPQPVIEHPEANSLDHDEIIDAVRAAWADCQPEVTVEQLGLERDEILTCIREGLQEHSAQRDGDNEEKKDSTTAIVYDDVLDAVKEGLQDFKLPSFDNEASITREEILSTVKECLEGFEFPAPPPRERELDITREDVLEAVKEGLLSQPTLSKEVEFNRDDLFDAVRAGLEGAQTPMQGVGEQVLDKMEDLLEGMRGEFKQYSSANGRDTEQVLDAMKDGLEDLRASVEGYVDRASDVTGKDEIIETVKTGLNSLRVDLEASIANANPSNNAAGSAELLDVMEREFEHLRSTIASSTNRSEVSSGGREELLDAIRDGFDEVHEKSSKSVISTETDAVEVVKEELQHLRETLASTMVRGGEGIDREEILETIQQGLATTINKEGSNIDRDEITEAVKDAIDKAQLGLSKDNGRPESILSNTSELIDHFNEGLENLKSDVERIVNRPIDMTVNYEILETLKEGLASVRVDLDGLRNHQTDARDPSPRRGGEVVIADEETARGLQQPEVHDLKGMIAHLQMKVDAFREEKDEQPPASQIPEDTVVKTDLEHMENMLREIQEAVGSLMEREQIQHDNTVTKEDTDAIETLLRNTKAQIEELTFPELETIAKTEHFEILETMLKNTKDAVEDLSAKQDSDSATKVEVAALELVVKEVQTSVQEIRDKFGEETVQKSDFETLANICTEHHTHFKDAVPEGETLPSKTDLDNLRDQLHDFQEKFDTDAEMTAQAFDARKTEHGGLADKIEDVKAFLDSVRKELKDSLDVSGTGLSELTTSLTVIGEAVTAANSAATMAEVKEILDREFEKAHANHDTMKTDFEQHRDVLFEKHDEHKAAVIEDLTIKIDARFDDLMTKYDDAQAAADAKAETMEDKATEQAENIASARAVTDDLKLLIDTLGATVTESCERVSEDSRTVFTKVEEINGKVDDAMQFLTVDGKADHQVTREAVSQALTILEDIQTHSTNDNPRLLSAVNEILSIVGQHFEASQKSSEEIKSSVRDIPSTIPVPALPAPQEPLVIEKEAMPVEKYDDTEVHSKLDRLVEYVSEADKSAAQIEILEEIKSQVTTTASEFQTFMNTQQATIMSMQEVRTRDVEEAGIALEKRSAQKEAVEADMVRLSDERSGLESSAQDLKREIENLRREKEESQREKEELASLKARLQADVSSLQTALEIRREEMQVMEDRAEGLERRIIEGVLDHSRSLLINSRPQSSLKSMNLKRVPSSASNVTITTKGSTVSNNGRKAPSVAASAVSSAVGMAMKKRQSAKKGGETSGPASPANRRILSLSTIGGNKGLAAEKSIVLAKPSVPGNTAFGGGLKRSHSVKSNFPSRKTSWGGTKQIGMYSDDAPEEDKENGVLEEEDEEGSEQGTDRRTSYTGTYTGTDLSYGTGSVTDSHDDRRTSYAASTIGTVAGQLPDESIDESVQGDGPGDEDIVGEGGNMQLYHGDVAQTVDARDGTKEVVVYGMPTDSGIGSDLPTAALEAGPEYFSRD